MARGWQPRKGDVSPRKEYIPQVSEFDSEYCKECGAYDPMQDEPQWHKSTCSINNEGETK